MPDSSTFRELALAAIAKGLRVCRLKPGDKRPLSEGWIKEATTSKMVVESWNGENPNYNCGAVVTDDCGYWVVDVDCLEFLMDECPHECMPVGGYQVKTGGGGRHFYFKGRGPFEGIKHVPNPNPEKYKKPNGKECKNVIDVICHAGQVLVAGNVHPESKRPYEVLKDGEMVEASPEFIGWLRSCLEAKKKPKAKGAETSYLVPKSWVPEVELAKANLKFERRERDGKVFLNYHVLMGKCLVKGSLHVGDAGNNEHNNECCGFVVKELEGGWDLGHHCHACGGVGTKDALAALGIEWKDILKRKLFLDVTRAGGYKPVPIIWAWADIVPVGKLWIGFGPGGVGKSLWMLLAIYCVVSGKDWPDGEKNRLGPREVLLATFNEDTYDEVVVPAMLAYGATKEEIDRIHCIEGLKDDAGEAAGGFSLDHLKLIEDYLQANPQIAYLMVNPLYSAFGQKKMKDGQDVRQTLDPLAALAKRLRKQVMAFHHDKKGLEASATNKMAESQQLSAAVRSVFLFKSDGPDEFVVVSSKANLAKKRGQRWRVKIVDHPLGPDADPDGRGWPILEYAGVEGRTAEEFNAQDLKKEKEKPKAENPHVEYLKAVLVAGPIERTAVYGWASNLTPGSDAGRKAMARAIKKGIEDGWIEDKDGVLYQKGEF